MKPARIAPVTAPTTVPAARVIPSRRSARPARTLTAAAPVDVATTQMRLVPTASVSGTPNPKVRMGTMRMPPPRPSIAPKVPAATPLSARRSSIGIGGSSPADGRPRAAPPPVER
jgi:hypothetical protein